MITTKEALEAKAILIQYKKQLESQLSDVTEVIEKSIVASPDMTIIDVMDNNALFKRREINTMCGYIYGMEKGRWWGSADRKKYYGVRLADIAPLIPAKMYYVKNAWRSVVEKWIMAFNAAGLQVDYSGFPIQDLPHNETD